MSNSTVSITLDDSRSYSIRLFAMFGVSFYSNCVGLYLILRRSPSELRVYRWYLFHILIWSFLMDLFLTLLIQPLPLFPIFGLCFVGMISALTRNTLWGVYVAGIAFSLVALNCFASIYVALCYRLTVLLDLNSRLRQWVTSRRGAFALCATVCGTYIIVTAYLLSFEIAIDGLQEELRKEIIQGYPGVRKVIQTNLCLFVRMDDRLHFILRFLILFFSVCLLAGLAMICVSVFILFYRHQKLSAKTYRMHRNFIVALFLQIALPTVMVVVPVITLAICANYDLPFPEASNNVLIVLNLHSSLNVVIMIVFTRPYVDFVKHLAISLLSSCFPKLKKKLNVQRNYANNKNAANAKTNTLAIHRAAVKLRAITLMAHPN